MAAQKITTQGFLSEFVERHKKMADRPFCWVLGSGTSVQSGISAGGTLAMQWLKEMHEREDFNNLPIEKWATAHNLGIKGFDFKKAESFYPFIYQRRYRDFREEGYAFLEDAMQGAEPSYGYSVLAQIMSQLQHKVAVTTNFDNLIADALATYTREYALVCGHESLTGFIRPHLKRPVIAKIHRDLLLEPKSEPEQIEKLPDEWETALQLIFENNTPIVLGYGGNDGSLMGFLKKMKPIKGGIFWCYRAPEEPDARVHQIVEQHHGRLVPVLGFDEIMLQLWEKLQLPYPIPELEAAHKKRVTDFQTQFEELNKRIKEAVAKKPADTELKEAGQAASAAVERFTKEKDWWAWQLKANAEPEPEKAEAIYREGLKEFPKSAELTSNFAIFLQDARKDYDEAERLYRKALELDPNDAAYFGNYARFLKNVRKDYDEAERLYRKALELDPKQVNNIGNYANFLTDVRKKHDEAERLYRKALELDPKGANHTGNFAIFLKDIRRDYDKAEEMFRKASELDPNDATIAGNFAIFLKDIPKDYDRAEELYRKALELDPKDNTITGNFAIFLETIRKDHDKAEEMYRKALVLDPKDGATTGNYASFLETIRKDHGKAEEMYRKALALDPKNAINTGNYAEFMTKVRKDFPEAKRLFRRALELDPNREWVKKRFAEFLKEHPEFNK